MVYPHLAKAAHAKAVSVCTLKPRINLLAGPPADPQKLPVMMGGFFSEQGKHVVCGGTTSLLVGEFLHRPVNTILPRRLDPRIPPMASIDGVDLVTEGLITIGQVLEYARHYLALNRAPWNSKEDGASKIARLLFEEGGELTFYVGSAVNPAHQSAGLGHVPDGYRDKTGLLKALETCLRKMGKQIQVYYF